MTRLKDKYTTYDDKKVLDLLKEFPCLFYSNDIKDSDMKRLKKFLCANKFNNIVLYHGTASNLSILEEGLKPTTVVKRRNSYQSTAGFVYLSLFKETAKLYGEIAYPHQDVTVYKVIVPIEDLKSDRDNILNATAYKGAGMLSINLINSLVYGSGACIKGKIEPYKLTLDKYAKAC